MKLKLSIPEPCHEAWTEMTANEKGRFCAACNKTVIDFRNMSTREIMDQLAANTGKSCGRFDPHQLGEKELVKPKPWAKYLAAAGIIAAVGTTKLAAQERMGKVKLNPVENYINEEGEGLASQPTKSICSPISIKGRVIYEGEPLIGVAVRIYGTDRGIFTVQNSHHDL
ncbi:MAG: hypothetical protein AAFN10_03340 [Bacteroidota bacterium]